MVSRRERRLRAVPAGEGPRERIHAAALRLFARYGFDGTSLQQIADEVGLHKSSLFHHYRSKAEIAAEVYDTALRQVLDIVRPLQQDDPPRLETMLAMADDLVEHFAKEPHAARLLMSVIVSPSDSDLTEAISTADAHLFQELSGILVDWIVRAREAGAIRHVNARQTLFNVFAVVLYYPAAIDEAERDSLAGPEPFSPKHTRIRKQELRILLRGVFQPD
jgi:TetR/AcrR family transcriptional regulator